MGPQGPAGQQGPPGPAGGGIVKTTIVESDVAVPSGVSTTVGASCPPADYVTGGGYSNSDSLTNYVFGQRPTESSGHPDGWGVMVMNNSGTTLTFSAYAVCAGS